MSRTIDIPGGQAVLRGKDEIKQRARRRLELASVLASSVYRKFPKDTDPREVNLAELGLSAEEFDAMYAVQDQTILAYLQSWTLVQEDGAPRPIPETVDDLGDLPVELYDALREATAPDGADTVAPVDFSPNPDPESPTVDGSASAGPSKDETESPSTPSSPTSGVNSPTGGSSAVVISPI